jgi:hypothetical protein
VREWLALDPTRIRERSRREICVDCRSTGSLRIAAENCAERDLAAKRFVLDGQIAGTLGMIFLYLP